MQDIAHRYTHIRIHTPLRRESTSGVTETESICAARTPQETPVPRFSWGHNNTHTHIHTHANTHAHTHTRTHTNTHTHTRAGAHTHPLMLIHQLTPSRTHSLNRTLSVTHVHTRPLTHPPTHSLTIQWTGWLTASLTPSVKLHGFHPDPDMSISIIHACVVVDAHNECIACRACALNRMMALPVSLATSPCTMLRCCFIMTWACFR